jgi:hypothetical protein
MTALEVSEIEDFASSGLANNANAVNYEFKNTASGMYFAHLIKNGNIETTLKVMYDQQ